MSPSLPPVLKRNYLAPAPAWKMPPRELPTASSQRNSGSTAISVRIGVCALRRRSGFRIAWRVSPGGRINWRLKKDFTLKNLGDAFQRPLLTSYRTFLVLLFLLCLFLGCHCSYSPFHCSWKMLQRSSTATS